MRRTLTAVVPTAATAQVGSARLSASEARARIEAGAGGVSQRIVSGGKMNKRGEGAVSGRVKG